MHQDMISVANHATLALVRGNELVRKAPFGSESRRQTKPSTDANDRPVVLTRDVILGLPPPIPVSYVPFRRNCPVLALRHEQCLFYTGKFIEAIDRRFHL